MSEEPSGMLKLGFYYNSQEGFSPWRLGISSLIPPKKGTNVLTIVEEDCHFTAYSYEESSGYYIAPCCASGRAIISFYDGPKEWMWFDPNTGNKKIYNEKGLLTKLIDTKGRELLLTYNIHNQLVKINASSGNIYEIRRANNQVKFYMLEFGQETLLQTHTFDNDGLLLKTIIGSKQDYEINYKYNGRLCYQFTQSDHSSFIIKYGQYSQDKIPKNRKRKNSDDIPYRAKSFLAGGYQNYIINYKDSKQVEINYNSSQKILVTVDDKLRFIKVSQSNGFAEKKEPDTETIFTYNSKGQVASVKKPNGAEYNYQYDNKYNVLSYVKRPDGSTTYYKHDEIRGGLLAKMDIWQSPGFVGHYVTTRHIYEYQGKDKNINRFLRFSLTPLGEITEYRYDAKGNLEYKLEYTRITFDLTEYDKQEQPSIEDLQKFVKVYADLYSKDMKVTKYHYNKCGQPEIIWEGGKSLLEGILRDNNIKTTLYSYTNFGKWTQKIESREKLEQAVITQRSFDSLYRETELICGLQDKLAKQETKYVYNITSDKTIHNVIQPNGKIEANELDNIGNVVQKTEMCTDGGSNRITKYIRDIIGRIAIKITADGLRHFYGYDDQDRLIYEVNPAGQIIEHVYKDKERYHATIKYNAIIFIKDLQPFPDIAPTATDIYKQLKGKEDPQQDRATYTFFDANERPRFSLDADLYITEMRYDTLGQVYCKIKYKSKLTLDQLEQLKAGKLELIPDYNKGDQITNTYYNDDGKVLAIIDAEGYVVENKRNAYGNITKQIHYENKVAKLGITDRDFAKIRPQKTEKDAYSYNFYDSRQRIFLNVNAEGFITTYTHYDNNLIKSKTIYELKVDTSWYDSPVNPPKVKPHKKDYSIEYYYDGLNRDYSIQHSSKKVINSNYNKINQKTELETLEKDSKELADPDKRRRVLKRFDQWGQCIAICSEMVAQKLAEIDIDPKIIDKKSAKEKIWNENSCRFSYDTTGLKVKMIDTLGKETLYLYDESRKLALIIKPTGAVTEFIYNTFNEITAKRAYNNPLTVAQIDIIKKLPNGFITSQIRGFLKPDEEYDIVDKFEWDKRGNIIQHIDPEEYLSAKTFNSMGKVDTEVQQVDKNNKVNTEATITIKHEYDLRGLETKVMQSSTDVEISTSKQYENPLGKITKLVDENGIEHQFNYDRVGNQIKIIGPDNKLLHQYEFNVLGDIISDTNALGYITRFDINHNDRTHMVILPEEGTQSTTTNNIFSEIIQKVNALKQYVKIEHAPNGKMAKTTTQVNSDESQDCINKNEFNTEGKIIKETKALDSVIESIDETTYDANNNIYQHIIDVGENKLNLNISIERDTFGRAKLITNPRGIIEERKYNKNNLVIESTRDVKGLRLITQTKYNGKHIRTDVTQGDEKNPEQYKVKFPCDALSRPIGKIIDPGDKSKGFLNLSQSNTLDNKGKVKIHQDPRGYKTYLFYNVYGKKRFEIKANGIIIELKYNDAQQPISRRQYNNKLDVSKLSKETTLDDIKKLVQPLQTIEDNIHNYFYDKNGRECFVVNYYYDFINQQTLGILTEKRYDGANRIISTLGYADYLTKDMMNKLSYDNLVDFTSKNINKSNRIDYSVYNAKGEERFHFDPEGAIVEKRYDKLGRIYQEIHYASKLSPEECKEKSQQSSDKISIKTTPGEDSIKYTIFDALKKPQFIVDGEFGVTYYEHDKNGNLILKCRFKDPIEQPKDYQDAKEKCFALKSKLDAKKDSIDTHIIDSVDRIQKTIDPYKYEDIYEHDSLDNLVQHTDRNGNLWSFPKYDAAKRLILKVSPKVSVTTVKRNIDGKLEESTVMRAINEFMEYDECNNVVKTIKDYSEDGTTDARELRAN